MLASTISGMSGPSSSRIALTRADILGQAIAPDLHLDRAEALWRGCPRSGAAAARAGTAGRCRRRRPARAARGRRAGARAAFPTLREQVPERGVDRRDRVHREPAAADVVERPPHLLPQRLDPGLVAARQQRREVAPDQVVHGTAAGAHGIGVAQPLDAVPVAQPHRDQLERRHHAMGRIRHRHRQRHPIVVRLDARDRHVPLPNLGPRST